MTNPWQVMVHGMKTSVVATGSIIDCAIAEILASATELAQLCCGVENCRISIVRGSPRDDRTRVRLQFTAPGGEFLINRHASDSGEEAIRSAVRKAFGAGRKMLDSFLDRHRGTLVVA